MARGVVKYIPIGNCPDPNYPATAPEAPVTKSGTPSAPATPPTGSTIVNEYIEQAAAAAIRFSNMKVGYFKLDLNNTIANLYGEAIEKWYYPPVEVRCLIERGTFTNTDTEFGVDTTQTLTVTVSKTEFETTYNFTPEVGDIITEQSKYYEVSSIDRQFVTIPGTGTSSSTVGGATNTPGFIVLYVLSCYLTRISKLNITKYGT